MKERLGLVLLAALSLTACNEQNDSNANTSANASFQGRSFSVIGHLRPQADPNDINRIHAEEQAAEQAKREAYEQQMKAAQQQQQANDPMQRNLPSATGFMANLGNLPQVNGGQVKIDPKTGMSEEQQRQVNAIMAGGAAGANPGNQSWGAPAPPPPPPSSYGINYGTPSPGFVPPPPAVSLSAQGAMFGGPPPPEYNPYANPYGYGQPPMQQAAPAPRSASSGFGTVTSGVKAAAAAGDDDDAPKKKKDKPMQIITPTGMEPRSPYKQRDELRVLWKGALATSLAGYSADSKFSEALAKIDVSLPGESSKGSLSVGQRQIDNLFKNNGAVDKKIVGQVKKTESDLVQAYYRFLYSYNKFWLNQQQLQARKQELDSAETQNEKQRATVDLANTQQEADSSKDDMKSSQNDLAAVVGAAAARRVIKDVSGVTPVLDTSVAQSDNSSQGESGGGGGLFNMFNPFGKGKKSEPAASSSDDAPPPKVAENKGKEPKEAKEPKEKKKGKEKQIAAKPPSSDAAKADTDSAPAAPVQAASGAPVSFELKDVKTTPRKSVLRVIVKNTGGDNFSFDADSISVAEGANKLADAAVNAEFDSTIVQPSQEVAGTITIFGRPWNDKLTVSLSSGNKPIYMHR